MLTVISKCRKAVKWYFKSPYSSTMFPEIFSSLGAINWYLWTLQGLPPVLVCKEQHWYLQMHAGRDDHLAHLTQQSSPTSWSAPGDTAPQELHQLLAKSHSDTLPQNTSHYSSLTPGTMAKDNDILITGNSVWWRLFPEELWDFCKAVSTTAIILRAASDTEKLHTCKPPCPDLFTSSALLLSSPPLPHTATPPRKLPAEARHNTAAHCSCRLQSVSPPPWSGQTRGTGSDCWCC